MPHNIIGLPALQDNYIWLIIDTRRCKAICVDPGEAVVVDDYLTEHKLTLAAILITHHHDDHVGGVERLQAQHPNALTYAAKDKRLPFEHESVSDGDEVKIDELIFQVLFTPGHTLTHHCFYQPNNAWVFVGDTLFSCGCGRLFEGTPNQMWDSLSRLAALPDETQVYCAHEYTRRNIDFALGIEPKNAALQQYAQSLSLPSLPSTIERERACNPFLRAQDPNLQQQLRSQGHHCSDPLSTFTVLRQLRNVY